MAARAVSKHVFFNNGIKCPTVGFGTWLMYGEEAYNSVKSAIDVGYRHIDTAFSYQNEKEVGRAINEKIKEGVIKREDLFVVSKLSSANHRKEVVVPALQKTLENLNLKQIDLFLVHVPFSTKPVDEGKVCLSSRVGEDGRSVLDDIDPVETWRGMEECVKLNLTRCIGLSNFNSQQTEQILNACTVKPVTNQVECHHLLNQEKLQNFLQERGIILTAYRSLGGLKNKNKFLHDERIVKLADKYQKTPAQFLLRWLIQRGAIVLPKSSEPNRIKENFDVYDFNISEEDMTLMAAFNTNTRFCVFAEAMQSKQYPFPHDVEF